ncbi:MAG: hypothetical protein IPL65_18635 [Lewinellaceae bacterium]|nr:hypothetical protein [Lewinellaceae bacterium]
MMRFLLMFLFAGLVSGLTAQNAGCDGVRYKVPVFSSIKKTTIQYAVAVSYFPNQTVNLFMDVYEPEGDTLSERPAVVLAHGGSFYFW